ncbi:anthranilate synthase component II [Metallumcola ferriviriculae]
MRVLIIDNYDSFTYNLVQMFGELGAAVEVRRNDRVTITEIRRIQPQCTVVSPGPGRPEDAGISINIIKEFYKTMPIMGVCLGHQCIAAAIGGRVERGRGPVHGKVSSVVHSGEGIFKGLPNPFSATRYHSLVVLEEGLSPELSIVARAELGEVMAIRHLHYPLWGLQFHPESFSTAVGKMLIKNFLAVVQ